MIGLYWTDYSIDLPPLNKMAEYSTTVAEDEKVAVISDSEGEEEDDGIVENFDGSPHVTLPPEVWAAVINCEYCYICY